MVDCLEREKKRLNAALPAGVTEKDVQFFTTAQEEAKVDKYTVSVRVYQKANINIIDSVEKSKYIIDKIDNLLIVYERDSDQLVFSLGSHVLLLNKL